MRPERPRVAIFISGRGSNMEALIEAARAPDCPHRIALVFSNVVDAPGLERAAALGIPTVALDHRGQGGREAYDRRIGEILGDCGGITHIALAGYLRILSTAFVDAWQGRMVNIHPSLLPDFPGLDTHARALAAGVSEHGCTVHFVTAELDLGPVIAQARVPVLADDVPHRLAARVLAEEHRIYPRALADLTSGRVRLENGRVRWSEPAQALR